MDISKKLREAVLSYGAETSAASIVVAFGLLAEDVLRPLLPYIEEEISKKSMLTWLGISLFLNLILLALLIIYKIKNRLRLKFGIFWGKNKTPYCPTCKTILSTSNPIGPLEDEYYCYSSSCKRLIYIVDTYGNPVSRKDAIDKL